MFQYDNESPRRKQRGIKDQNRKKHSPQAAGYLPEEKNKFMTHYTSGVAQKYRYISKMIFRRSNGHIIGYERTKIYVQHH